ncbi:MAG TPA: hypothetical protein DCW90_19755 [Lachnospiraceae bacterium]|nr:hypothetical protein [Lachnospiraceae bacterium]
MKTKIIQNVFFGFTISVIVLAIAYLVASLIVIPLATSFNDHTYDITITGKERITNGDRSDYLIFCQTTDEKTLVLKNSDNLVRGKYNSSDLYGEIEEGKNYRVNVVGYRVQFLDWYENILSIEEVG